MSTQEAPLRLRYYFSATLLILFLFPISVAHATYPENVTATPGYCTTGNVTLSWDPPAEGAYIAQSVTDTHDFSDGNPALSETLNFANPLPPGNYSVETFGFDNNWQNQLWYDPDTFNPSFTVPTGHTLSSYVATGTIPDNDGAVDNTQFLLFADASNPNAIAYAISDNGTVIATTSATTYTLTGLNPTKSHYIEVGTIVANQPANWWVGAVSCPVPDLTSWGTNNDPSYGTTGESESFTANVFNAGNADASNFPNIFQIMDSTMTNTIARVDAGIISSLPRWGTTEISSSYTFNTPGDYNIRACANMDTSGAVTTLDSDPDNNCSAWQPLNVSPPAPSCPTLSVNKTDINAGDPVTLTWSCRNASSCTEVSNTDGFVTGGSLSGSHSATPTATGPATYGLTCDGSTFYFPSVTVHSPTVSLIATPARVPAGATTTIAWSSSDTSSCSITKNGKPFSSGPTSSLGVADTITGQTKYVITCHTYGADVTSSIVANVGPDFQDF
jgi:hypothetical protein